MEVKEVCLYGLVVFSHVESKDSLGLGKHIHDAVVNVNVEELNLFVVVLLLFEKGRADRFVDDFVDVFGLDDVQLIVFLVNSVDILTAGQGLHAPLVVLGESGFEQLFLSH
jgi:hypothetical protein